MKERNLTPARAAGLAIKQLRQGRNMTQAELCRAIDAPKGYAAKYEAGERMTLDNLVRIAKALGTSWVYIVSKADAIMRESMK